MVKLTQDELDLLDKVLEDALGNSIDSLNGFESEVWHSSEDRNKRRDLHREEVIKIGKANTIIGKSKESK